MTLGGARHKYDTVREMPRYKSHKIVWALKITKIERHSDLSGTLVTEEGWSPVSVDAEYMQRVHETENDQGYYVLYDDGYASWSPTKAFEDGYDRM